MLGHLVIDYVRRNWVSYGTLLGSLLLLGLVKDSASLISTPKISLGVALFLGPLSSMTVMSNRELRHLPLTTQDLWRMVWTLATVVPSSVVLVSGLLIATVPGFFGGTSSSIEPAVLLSVYVFAWMGVLLRMFVLLGYSLNATAKHNLTLRLLRVFAIVTTTGAALYLPFWLSNRLPTAWTGFTPIGALILVVCVGVSIGSFFWTPHRSTPDRTPAVSKPAGDIPSRAQWLDRLTGLPRVFIPNVFLAFTLFILFAVLAEAYAAFSGDRDVNFMLAMFAAFLAVVGPWATWVRLLKVLPLSVGQINALLVFSSVPIWFVLWSTAMAATFISHNSAPAMSPQLAFALAGIASLGNALGLATPKIRWLPIGLGFFLVKLIDAGSSHTTAAVTVPVVVGAVSLVAAAFANDYALRHASSSSATYNALQLSGDGALD